MLHEPSKGMATSGVGSKCGGAFGGLVMARRQLGFGTTSPIRMDPFDDISVTAREKSKVRLEE